MRIEAGIAASRSSVQNQMSHMNEKKRHTEQGTLSRRNSDHVHKAISNRNHMTSVNCIARNESIHSIPKKKQPLFGKKRSLDSPEPKLPLD